MLEKDVAVLIGKLQERKTELNYVEVKAAHEGCPHKLYDTISAFSNLAGGGIIIFGISEQDDFSVVGVYDANDLQKKVTEQFSQMVPKVRGIFTTITIDDKVVVAVEIPEIDIVDKPCFYSGRGRLTGSYIRVGDSDEPMTEYEIYSYEAFRRKYQDDVRCVASARMSLVDSEKLARFFAVLRARKTRLAGVDDKELSELMRLTVDGEPTLVCLLLFGRYPQGLFPQLTINAVVLAGDAIGEVGSRGERFIDNRRIDGTIPEMLEEAIAFVKKNMRKRTIVNNVTGAREDEYDYPIVAVREAIINALIHRDYSIHTEGMPIQLTLYSDRLEVISPGGIYGRLRISDLGKIQPDTRNPALAVMMEDMELTENRYSGIPTIYRVMREHSLPEPIFSEGRGAFRVTLKNTPLVESATKDSALVSYCAIPRSREEIAAYLGVKTVNYVMKKYIEPLLAAGRLKMTIPDKPRSKLQKYIAGRE